ncbi:MAG: hypothetical protein V1739_03335 [Candidatus Omnitrophota bacterium]
MLKKIIIVILATLCLALAIFFQQRMIGTVYTHLFYIPIILACTWWQKKGIAIALIFSVSVVLIHFIFRPHISFTSDALRSLLFIIVSVLVSKLSIAEKKYHEQTAILLEKQLDLSKTLQDQNNKLIESNKKTEEKNEELKKFFKLTVGREIKMIELKNELNKLKGNQ